jgi:hypothetical protein
MDNYKEASRLRLKFSSSVGQLNVEQLWDLKLTELTSLVKELKKQLTKSSIDNNDDELAFLEENVVVDATAQLRFDIVKDIYLTKKQEQDMLRDAKNTKEHNQKILALIAKKQESSLEEMSIAELEAKLIK